EEVFGAQLGVGGGVATVPPVDGGGELGVHLCPPGAYPFVEDTQRLVEGGHLATVVPKSGSRTVHTSGLLDMGWEPTVGGGGGVRAQWAVRGAQGQTAKESYRVGGGSCPVLFGSSCVAAMFFVSGDVAAVVAQPYQRPFHYLQVLWLGEVLGIVPTQGKGDLSSQVGQAGEIGRAHV